MDCSKCKRTDVKCCYTCKKDADKCKVYHKCGSDCPEYETRVITNADRIRNMDDAELAEFIDYNEVDCARFCPDYKAGCSWTCKHNQGKDFLLKWLQSEAE